ncbi:hypothetical protein GobsT_28860 [Gemmata obscuriglobus]|nr:hypothetical protein [Gemmata obscuriglobus]QEG28112.1 hypothetical protein GobsT_28860 [Gemmata obscuriglobus]VTS05757.1 unnamed protein product [Gemmata obscuriglobus UQM 2246]
MSYDLVFWRQTVARTASPVDTYRCLCRSESVDDIGELTAAEIHAAFAAEFPDLIAEPNELLGPMFSVMLYARPVRAVFAICSRKVLERPEVVERIIRVGRDSLGCCYFNPQSGEFSVPLEATLGRLSPDAEPDTDG